MSPSADPDRREDGPTIGEVAALTRRLRALYAQGRDADPVERAAFLADKHALLDRITAAHDDGARVPGEAARDGAGTEAHDLRELQDGALGRVGQGVTVDTTHAVITDEPSPASPYSGVSRGREIPDPAEVMDPGAGWEMPGWMREQAVHAEAEWADAGGPPSPDPARGDDYEVLAARVAALREQITRSAATAAATGLDGEASRREQLTRWRHDDSTADQDTAEHRTVVNDPAAESGWSR